MKLSPFDPAAEALAMAGLLPASSKNLPSGSNFQEILNDYGASVDNAARAIARVMQDGDHSDVLRAANLALTAHGVLKEAEKPSLPVININIHGAGSKNLMQLVTPTLHTLRNNLDNVNDA